LIHFSVRKAPSFSCPPLRLCFSLGCTELWFTCKKEKAIPFKKETAFLSVSITLIK